MTLKEEAGVATKPNPHQDASKPIISDNTKFIRIVTPQGSKFAGKICKIGGLSAKLNGAKKAGIRIIFISEENQTDYEMIKQKNPELFDDSFKIIVIKHIIDIVTNPSVIIDIDPPNDFDPNYLINPQ